MLTVDTKSKISLQKLAINKVSMLFLSLISSIYGITRFSMPSAWIFYPGEIDVMDSQKAVVLDNQRDLTIPATDKGIRNSFIVRNAAHAHQKMGSDLNVITPFYFQMSCSKAIFLNGCQTMFCVHSACVFIAFSFH